MRFLTNKFMMFILILAFDSVNAQEGCVTVRAIDESGQVVSNALVSAGFGTMIKPGWGWGGGKPNIVKGYTDTDGICVLKGEGNSGEIAVAITKDGYYGSGGFNVALTNLTGIAFNKWQPWNPTLEIVLKKKVNPIPLYSIKYGSGIRKRIPELDKAIAFDLEKADWVAPYGRGETTDFIFRLDRQLGGKTRSGYQIFDATFNLSFSAPDDGIQSVYAKLSGEGSELRLPRLAPEQGYETNLVRHAYEHDNGSFVERREDQNYFFRVRTKKDEKGNIVSALYGKIHGEIDADLSRTNNSIRFIYYLNTTPNDRNLEFDPKRNLFKNLKSTEQVTAP